MTTTTAERCQQATEYCEQAGIVGPTQAATFIAVVAILALFGFAFLYPLLATELRRSRRS